MKPIPLIVCGKSAHITVGVKEGIRPAYEADQLQALHIIQSLEAGLRKAGEGKSSIPWLRHDISKEIDPRQPRPKAGIEYGEQLAKKIVNCLQDLEKDEKMDKDGVYWF
ncbi:unnamed protein product [Penicillium camemberti]|uniref:Str. FM013 n=1 Tax=Penicillium camemberti (strain FM 013) TaxID=1429867 RepID=A0A0G4PQH4_PENC3|nr:unnamed protein product [Penicillium camemberti]